MSSTPRTCAGSSRAKAETVRFTGIDEPIDNAAMVLSTQGLRRATSRFVAMTAVVALLAGCSVFQESERPQADPLSGQYAGRPVVVDGRTLPSRVEGDGISLGFGDRFEQRFWPGVNLGATTPGFSPGELSPEKSDYMRWFKMMTQLGVRVVRIYTIQRPAFYQALRSYNRSNTSSPLYVIHGVWIPEDEFLHTQNAYDASVTEGFKSELRDANAVIHGKAHLPDKQGHASGKYRSDVSQWVAAWAIGVEWDPFAVVSTNEKNRDVAPYQGRFVSATSNASPMESWIASMLDHTAALDDERGWSRPITFTNWLTTDPLPHPDEPLAQEDAVSIDSMHMTATPAWKGGLFASYHAYPYYPDFMKLQPSYATYVRGTETPDPYAGYLHELKQHHSGQAVMITEFGLPTSVGRGHSGPLGRDQGGHSEQGAASHVADMMRHIRAEGMAGGIIFEWTDEWFKFTWNTVEYELPQDRRAFWRNPLTNEEHFGILATEPGSKDRVVIDGLDDEWNDNESKALAERANGMSEMRVTHDEENLYILLEMDEPQGWRGKTLAFDVRPGDNGGIEGRPGVEPSADVQITFGTNDEVTLKQASWTDPISRQYGVVRKYFAVDPATLVRGTNNWVELRQVQNRPQYVPSTGVTLPIEMDSRSQLRWGTTDPKSPQFDERNLVMGVDRTLELRVPWSYLTFSDPSTHQVYLPTDDGTITHESTDDMVISLVGPQPDATITRGKPYGWENWNEVEWHERRKAGWDVLTDAFIATATR